MYLVYFVGDELYFILLRKMTISWCCFYWSVIMMESTFGMKNKRNNVESQDLVEGKETWVFTNTECKIDQNISFQWNQLFEAFLTNDYQMLLQDDPCKELCKEMYKNISKFGIYRFAAKSLILSCPDVIEWMTRKVDHSNIITLNFEGKKVASY